MKFFKYYFYVFIFILLFLLSPKTYALVNNNTTYEITMPDYSQLLDFQCGDYNFKEELDNLLQSVDTSSLNFGFTIMNRLSLSNHTSTIGVIDNVVDIYFYSKIYLFSNFSIYYANDNDLNFRQRSLPFSSSYQVSHINFYASSCNSLDNNNTWNILKNALENNVIPTVDNNNYEFPFWYSYGSSNSGLNITNNSSYSATYWYYYTNYDLYYSYGNNQNTSNSSLYFKKLHIIDNDSYYTINSRNDDGPLPSYVDIYGFGNNNGSTSIDYLSSLGTIYNNFSPNDLSTFNLDIKFYTNSITALNYNQNLNYRYGCYGRVNHGNYYTYEEFSSCSIENNGDYVLDSNLLNLYFENLTIYDSNDNLITNFSNYDKLFIYFDFQYNDSSIDTTLYNLSITSIGNYIYTDNFRGTIYDNFENLPLYFKLFVSTIYNNYSYFSARYSGSTLTNQYFLYRQEYNTSSLDPIGNTYFLGSNFITLSVNNNLNLGYMFYHQISFNNSGIDIPSIDFIINKNIMISFNDSFSNNFYYYDSNGNIINNNIVINYDNTSTNSYNLDYYFKKIIDFEFEYNEKINNLHDLFQDFYDSTPLVLQTSIFILFIFLCIYIIFKEVRR